VLFKSILSFVLLANIYTTSQAASLFLKLIDERERPVMNARFYWKHPNQEEYQQFEKQVGNGQLRRHREGFEFNYEIAKSVRVGGDNVDIKIVADRYEVKVRREWIPDGSEPRESQILVVLEAEKIVYNNSDAPTPLHPESSDQPRSAPVRIDIMVKNQVDPRIYDGPPLPGVIVEVQLEATGETYSARTDASGLARFNVPNAGRAHIRLSKDGFRGYRWRANLESGRVEKQELALRELAPAKSK